jgi:hypothetical protein
VIAIDDGPGIADIERSLGDGFSTGGTPGTGLGAVRRLASTSTCTPACRTARWWWRACAGPRPDAAGAKECDLRRRDLAGGAGRTVCGDGWGFALRRRASGDDGGRRPGPRARRRRGRRRSRAGSVRARAAAGAAPLAGTHACAPAQHARRRGDDAGGRRRGHGAQRRRRQRRRPAGVRHPTARCCPSTARPASPSARRRR